MRILLVLIMLILVTANVSFAQKHSSSDESCVSLCAIECEFENSDLIVESHIEIFQFEKLQLIIPYSVRPSYPSLFAPKRPPRTNA